MLPKAEQELRFRIRKVGMIDPDYLRRVDVLVHDCPQCPYGFVFDKMIYCTMAYRGE